MNRKTFLTLMAGTTGMAAMGAVRMLHELYAETDVIMPALFVGHGSPMNGIEDNLFSNQWKKLGTELPVPKAVLVISAHWLTKGTFVTAVDKPQTIHDFGGFPQALFDAQYPATGDPQLAKSISELITEPAIGLDHEWGLDHGSWTILKHIYPKAEIPVLQLSIDYNQPPSYHYELAKAIAGLRKRGILIIGSGNMVHNLRMVDFARLNEDNYGFDWALELNDIFKTKILAGDHQALINYTSLHKASKLAIPTPDHYYPLLYTLGLQQPSDTVRFFNDRAVAGSLTMTSVVLGTRY
jgi:4,5-DOPA dioxygenase extradiol